MRELPSDFKLSHGAHSDFSVGACLMEAVAYFAGEPHSDEPSCVSKVLTAIGIRLNDRWTDDERQLLVPLIPRLVGTRTTREHDTRRAYVMLDASVREIAPMGLDVAKATDLADRLRSLAPLVDWASARAARPLIEAIRDDARRRRDEAWKRRTAATAADVAYAAAAAAATAADVAYAAFAAYAAFDAYAAFAATADADAAYAAFAAYAADVAYAAAADYAAAAAAKTPEERARIRAAARRPIVEATVRAFERAIEAA